MGIERREYSAGAVKLPFWFMEFRKEVSLLAGGKSFDEIKNINACLKCNEISDDKYK